MDWKHKLTSRKLWVAIAGFVSALLVFMGKSESTAAQVGSLILAGASVVGYIFGEGLVDAAREQTIIQIAPDEIEDLELDDLPEIEEEGAEG